jgi:hypothetical protein
VDVAAEGVECLAVDAEDSIVAMTVVDMEVVMVVVVAMTVVGILLVAVIVADIEAPGVADIHHTEQPAWICSGVQFFSKWTGTFTVDFTALKWEAWRKTGVLLETDCAK